MQESRRGDFILCWWNRGTQPSGHGLVLVHVRNQAAQQDVRGRRATEALPIFVAGDQVS